MKFLNRMTSSLQWRLSMARDPFNGYINVECIVDKFEMLVTVSVILVTQICELPPGVKGIFIPF